MHRHINIVDQRDLWWSKVQCGESLAQALGRRAHQARVERGRHRQAQGPFGASGLEPLAGTLDRRLAASDHRLCRVVEVDCLDHLAGAGLELGCHQGTARYHATRLHAQNGRHGTRAYRHGVLHGLGTKTHQRRSLGQGQHPGGHQRRILAQGVARHRCRRQAGLSRPNPVRCDSGQQHHRLGVGGEGEHLFGALGNQGCEVLPQRLRGLLHSLANRRMISPSVEHTDRLRTLTWKNKGKRSHVIAQKQGSTSSQQA